MKDVTVTIERHEDGFVAHCADLQGVVVGQGETYEEALADITSAVRFHLETFEPGSLDRSSSAFIRVHPRFHS